jgi:hypothetical protein
MGGSRPDMIYAGRSRILVNTADEAKARAILATLDEASPAEDVDKESFKKSTHSKRVKRGFFAAILGLVILPPVLMHLYALVQLVPALKDWGHFSRTEKIKASFTIVISLTVFYVAVRILKDFDFGELRFLNWG